MDIDLRNWSPSHSACTCLCVPFAILLSYPGLLYWLSFSQELANDLLPDMIVSFNNLRKICVAFALQSNYVIITVVTSEHVNTCSVISLKLYYMKLTPNRMLKNKTVTYKQTNKQWAQSTQWNNASLYNSRPSCYIKSHEQVAMQLAVCYSHS